MTELRVVGGLFRYCHPVDGRILIGSDLPYGFVYPGQDGEPVRKLRSCTGETLVWRTGWTGFFIAVRTAAWTSGFLTIGESLLYRGRIFPGYRDPALLWLFERPYLHPSLGLNFRLGFRFRLRFAGKGNQPFYRGLAFVFLKRFTGGMQFLVADRGLCRPCRGFFLRLFFGLFFLPGLRLFLRRCCPALFFSVRFLVKQRDPVVDLTGAVGTVLGKDQFHGLDIIIDCRFYREHQHRDRNSPKIPRCCRQSCRAGHPLRLL